MRDLKGIDAWVLCVDSNGINVWCAARGKDFGNKQLIEAVEATGIEKLTDKKTLILPQLSAGGVSTPELTKKSSNFPFRIVYGPVWSKKLPEFLEKRPARKTDEMKLAKFTLKHRFRGFITHTTFLLRKIFIYPLIILFFVFLLLDSLSITAKLWWVGELLLWIVTSNFIITFMYPLANFTRRFIIKGVFFGTLNVFILGIISYLFHYSIIFTLWNLSFFFWISFFSTMSLSGYTMATSPSEIQEEYPIFSKINKVLLTISLISLVIGIVFL